MTDPGFVEMAIEAAKWGLEFARLHPVISTGVFASSTVIAWGAAEMSGLGKAVRGAFRKPDISPSKGSTPIATDIRESVPVEEQSWYNSGKR